MYEYTAYIYNIINETHKWRRSTHSRKWSGEVGGGVEDHRSPPFAEPLIERRHCRRRPTNHALVGRPVNGGDGGRKKIIISSCVYCFLHYMRL